MVFGYAALAEVESISIKRSSEPQVIVTEPQAPATQPSLVISVDIDHPGQTIDGMGGAFNEMGWQALEALDQTHRDQVLRALFDPANGANLAFNRIPIGASDFALSAYSLDDSPGDWDLKKFTLKRDERCLIPYIKSAQQFNRAMRFHASPWSPPGWLKTSGSMSGQKTALIDNDRVYRTYARYLVKFLQGYAEHGIVVNRLCPQNEPVVDPPYPGCLIPAAQYAKLTEDWIIPAIAASGLKTEVWAGTFNFWRADTQSYFREIEANAKLVHAVRGVSFQYSNIHFVEEFRKKYPDVPLQFSESECFNGANSESEAKRDFQDAVAYFRTGIGLFTYWNMVLPEPCKSTWGWAQDSPVVIDKASRKVTFMPSYAVAKLLGRQVRAGARYLPSHIDKGADEIGPLKFPGCVPYMQTELQDGNQVAAFQEQDGSVVIYLLNQGEETTAVIKIGSRSVKAVLPKDRLCAVVVK
jgi:glucosylceramidase